MNRFQLSRLRKKARIVIEELEHLIVPGQLTSKRRKENERHSIVEISEVT
jgi:hypothetical protein